MAPENCQVFPLIADPQRYVASTWNLRHEPALRAYWVALFRRHFPTLAREAVLEAGGGDAIEAKVDAATREFFAYLDAAADNADDRDELTILEICKVREEVLRRQGIADPYRIAKQRENDKALAVLPRLLQELDQLDRTERTIAITQGIFAGNIFDLGATDTERLFREAKGVDFHHVRQQLKPRPWLIDDFDTWAAHFNREPGYRCALLFVDNAGSDVVLGMIPFARELLLRGSMVILTANSKPSLNDVTYDELLVLMDRVAAIDPTLRDALVDGRLKLTPSGNWLPLIDLRCVSKELADLVRAHPVDLLVLEGMGRAVESNLHASFTCDTLKIAMIKDEGVADSLGGTLYDLVLRFEPRNTDA